jgi:hypothetical protein
MQQLVGWSVVSEGQYDLFFLTISTAVLFSALITFHTLGVDDFTYIPSRSIFTGHTGTWDEGRGCTLEIVISVASLFLDSSALSAKIGAFGVCFAIIRHSPQLCTGSTYTVSSWKRNIKTRFASKTPLINAKRGSILSILCLMLVSLEFLVAAPEPFLCINSFALCLWSLALDSLSARLLQT